MLACSQLLGIEPGSTATTICKGSDFLRALFLCLKALFLRALALCLADAVGQISPVLDLRERVSLFFLCWLVDVSISWGLDLCGFQGSGWTLSLHKQRG